MTAARCVSVAGRAELAALACMALAMALPPGAHASVLGDLIGHIR